jgi:hypothetical protein
MRNYLTLKMRIAVLCAVLLGAGLYLAPQSIRYDLLLKAAYLSGYLVPTLVIASIVGWLTLSWRKMLYSAAGCLIATISLAIFNQHRMEEESRRENYMTMAATEKKIGGSSVDLKIDENRYYTDDCYIGAYDRTIGRCTVKFNDGVYAYKPFIPKQYDKSISLFDLFTRPGSQDANPSGSTSNVTENASSPPPPPNPFAGLEKTADGWTKMPNGKECLSSVCRVPFTPKEN